MKTEENLNTLEDLPLNAPPSPKRRDRRGGIRQYSVLTTKFAEALNKYLEIDKRSGFEDGRITLTFFGRLYTLEIACLTISIIGIGLSVIEYDLEFTQEHDPLWAKVLLYIIFIASILLAFLTVVRYQFFLEYQKKRKSLPQRATLFSTGMYRKMIAEIVIILIIPYPWLLGDQVETTTLYDDTKIYYNTNSIIQLFSTLRLIVVVRLILHTTIWSGNRSNRICEMYAVKPDLLFTIKCAVRTNPLTLIFSSYLISIPLFAYMLRIAEGPTDRIPGNTTYLTYWNSLWCVIITMSTVGYGDYYPLTLLGRMITFFVSIWGTTIISMMVIAITDLFTIGRLESKSFTVIKRVLTREKMREHAAFVLTNLVRGTFKTKKTGAVPRENLEKVKKHLKQFKVVARNYRELADETNSFEVMDREFTFIQDQFKGLHRKANFVIESDKMILEVLGANAHVVERMNNMLKSTIFSLKSSMAVPAYRAEKEKSISLDANAIIEEELTGLDTKRIPYVDSVNGAPGSDYADYPKRSLDRFIGNTTL